MRLIRPWLFVGKVADTHNLSLLTAHQIGAMLQLAYPIEQSGIESLYVDVEDGVPLPALALRRGMDFVNAQRAQNKNILIACGAGIVRGELRWRWCGHTGRRKVDLC